MKTLFRMEKPFRGLTRTYMRYELLKNNTLQALFSEFEVKTPYHNNITEGQFVWFCATCGFHPIFIALDGSSLI